MAKKIAVVLAGCGVFDGAEIYESVLTLYALERQGVEVTCFAPNIEQMHVINHMTGEEMPESRNVLIEASRIVRGEISDLAAAKADDFDALVVPGGFGAAKNLSDFAVKGADMTVEPTFLAFAQAMHKAEKPIGLICIAPAMAAKICGENAECTIGTDEETAAAVEASGAKHMACSVEQTHIDLPNKLVTTPAYMLAGSIGDAATGIERLVEQVIALA